MSEHEHQREFRATGNYSLLDCSKLEGPCRTSHQDGASRSENRQQFAVDTQKMGRVGSSFDDNVTGHSN